MRLSVFMLGLAALFASAARADDDCCWTPDARQIAAVEATIESLHPPRSLDQYARYYAGWVGPYGPIIRFGLVPAGGVYSAGIHAVNGQLPQFDSECIGIGYPRGGKPSLTCRQFGSWTPGAEDIAAMEAKIEQPGLPLGSLDRYARYYAGVLAGDNHRTIYHRDPDGWRIEDGYMPRRIIMGRLVSGQPG
jgi:hypothetical protein